MTNRQHNPSKLQKRIKGLKPVTTAEEVQIPTIPQGGSAADILSRRAVLVKVSIRTFQGIKKDKDLTQELAQRHGVDNAERILETRKRLMKGLLKKTAKPFSKMRNRHYELTVPYSWDGWALCPSPMLMDYLKEMDALERDCWAQVEEAISGLEEAKELDRKTFNGTFNPKDYPDAAEFRARYKLERAVAPVPAFGDWLPDVLREEADKVMAAHEAKMRLELAHAQSKVYARLLDKVGHVIERLSSFGEPVGKGNRTSTFRDSLIDSLNELVTFLPSMNIAEDSDLKAHTETLAKALQGLTPDAVRESPETREALLETACAVAADLLDSGKARPVDAEAVVTSTGNSLADLEAAFI